MYFPNDVDVDYPAVVNGTLPNTDAPWRESLEQVARMARFARSRGSTLALAAIPPFEQTASRQSSVHYQDVLRTFYANDGIAFIDPWALTPYPFGLNRYPTHGSVTR